MNTRELSQVVVNGESALAVATAHGISLELVNKRLRDRWSMERAVTEARRVSLRKVVPVVRAPRQEFTPEERAVMRWARVTSSLAKLRMRDGMSRELAISTIAPRAIPTPEERGAMRVAGVSRQLWSARMANGWDRAKATTTPPNKYTRRSQGPDDRCPVVPVTPAPQPEFTPEERAMMRWARVTTALAKQRMRDGMSRELAVSTIAPRAIPTPEERTAMSAAGVIRQIWDWRMANGWDREKATVTPPNKYTRRPKARAHDDRPSV